MSDIWKHLKYFTPSEFSYPEKMSPSFLYKLDQFRQKVGIEFRITEDYATKGHAANSMHYKGRAVDGRFFRNGQPVKIDEMIRIALICPFSFGLYTDSYAPFFHFDDREEKATWLCEVTGNYKPITVEFLRKALG